MPAICRVELFWQTMPGESVAQIDRQFERWLHALVESHPSGFAAPPLVTHPIRWLPAADSPAPRWGGHRWFAALKGHAICSSFTTLEFPRYYGGQAEVMSILHRHDQVGVFQITGCQTFGAMHVKFNPEFPTNFNRF